MALYINIRWWKCSNGFIGNGTGTKFKIEGDNLWGYDITLFNVCKEKEILLEPESKYVVENIKEGNIIEVTCKLIDKPQIVQICNFIRKKKVSIFFLCFSVL